MYEQNVLIIWVYWITCISNAHGQFDPQRDGWKRVGFIIKLENTSSLTLRVRGMRTIVKLIVRWTRSYIVFQALHLRQSQVIVYIVMLINRSFRIGNGICLDTKWHTPRHICVYGEEWTRSISAFIINRITHTKWHVHVLMLYCPIGTLSHR